VTFEHVGPHLWTGRSPKAVRCGFMGCGASPSATDIKRLADEVRAARALRIDIDFRVPDKAQIRATD
jgi:hypothetical protein